MTNGVPVVTWPHYGDQHINSSLITDKKAGITLFSEPRGPFEKDFEKISTYEQPVFDYAQVINCFNKVLRDPIYAQNIEKM